MSNDINSSLTKCRHSSTDMSRSKVFFLLSLCSLCLLGCSQETRQDESCACISNCKIADRYIQNGTCRKENVALGKVATMSDRYNDQAWGGQSGPACLANNGNMNREYLGESQGGGPRCILTTLHADGWWQVDLGRNYTVSSIAVYGREQSILYIQRMPTSITVNEQSIYTGTPNEIDLIINLSKTTIGQTVTVSTNTSREFLNICQVQVWVDQCSCISGNTTSCSPEGHCRMDNVALGKVAYMSSVYVEQTASQACLAVDGSPGLRHNTITSSNCIMSSPADDYPWWEVDLGQDYTINKITVYTLESYVENMKGVEISVDGQTCYTFPNTAQPSSTNDVKCSQARKGKFVTFTSRDNKQLILCEVQIWVCISGFYGESCKECGKCNNATCDIENGTCPASCELGFTGPLCQECAHGYYGNESACIPCGKCINGSACSNITGHCDDCEKGWQQPLCNVCDDKHYDSNCSSECGHCFNNGCNKLNGICNYGCEAGWWNPTCKDECPVGLYGRNCKETCGRCLNNSDCDPVNGSCAGSCLPGSTGIFCSVIATSEESGNSVGPIVGAIFGGFIILSISLSVTIIYLRRYKSRRADSINTTSNALQPATDTQASIQPSKQDESATEYDEIGNPYDSLHAADDSENHNYASHGTEERKSKSNEDKSVYLNVITKKNF